MTEFNLSKKMIKNGTQIPTKFVKEFIKEVFKIVNNVPKINRIKKLAGEKLTND